MNIFNIFFKSRDKPKIKNDLTLSSPEGWVFSSVTTSGKYVSADTAMNVSAVYACVKILSEAVASLPLHVFTREADGSKKHIPEHSLYNLLHDEANPEMTSFVWRETAMAHLLLWGNSYSQIIRNGRGQPVALYPMNPSKMTVSRNDKGKLIYTYMNDGGEVKFNRENILHIPGLGFDGLVGYSPITMQRNSIGLSMAAEEYGAKLFANGAIPGGVLEHPGTIKNIEKLKESWNAAYRGSGNAGKTAILEEGMKFHAIGINPEDAQFLETRKYQKNEIASIFRIPPHMIGDLEKSSFSNIEQMSLDFVKYTLNPWIARWEQSLKQALILPSEKSRIFIMFNLDGLLRGDYQSRMSGYATGIQHGWLSPNDVRNLEDMNKIPAEEGGDNYMVNGNMVKLKDVGAAYNKNSQEGDE